MSQPESQIQPEITDYRTSPIEPNVQQAEPARLGPLQRLMGVLFSPGETFQDINRKPTWLAPMVISIVLGACGSLFVNWWINPDWNRITRDMIRQQVNRGGPELTEEQIQQRVRIQQIIGKVIPLGIVAIVPIASLIIGGIYALGMMLMQAQTTFKKVLSVLLWTSCSVGLVNGIVTNASLMVRDRESLNAIKNPMDPGSLSATNLGVVLGSDTSPVLMALASSVDLFSIWSMILMAIGLAAIAGSRKITTKKTATLVVSLWVVVVLLRVLGAVAFGGGR